MQFTRFSEFVSLYNSEINLLMRGDLFLVPARFKTKELNLPSIENAQQFYFEISNPNDEVVSLLKQCLKNKTTISMIENMPFDCMFLTIPDSYLVKFHYSTHEVTILSALIETKNNKVNMLFDLIFKHGVTHNEYRNCVMIDKDVATSSNNDDDLSALNYSVVSVANLLFKLKDKTYLYAKHPLKQKLKIKNYQNKTKAHIKFNDVVLIKHQKTQSSPQINALNLNWQYSHRWRVMGHWRNIEGIGKNRQGEYCVEGKTWVLDHIRGPEGLDIIEKKRVYKE